MYTCPHCNERTLGTVAVRWSYRENPARCPKCGNLWHVLASSSNAILGTELVLGALALVLAMVLESYAVFLAGLSLVAVHNWWAWREVDLFPIPKEAAAAAARVSWWLLLLGAFIKLFTS